MKKTAIIIFIIVLVGIGVLYIKNREGTTPQASTETASVTGAETPNVLQTQDQGQTISPLAYCNLTINAPLAASSVAFPLTIDATRGVITDGQCNWGISEAVGGTVKVLDTQGTVLASAQIHTTSEWTTTEPVTLAATIPAPTQPIVSGTPLTLVFTSDDASGATPDTFSMQVYAQ